MGEGANRPSRWGESARGEQARGRKSQGMKWQRAKKPDTLETSCFILFISLYVFMFAVTEP